MYGEFATGPSRNVLPYGILALADFWWCPACIARPRLSREKAYVDERLFKKVSRRFSSAQQKRDTTEIMMKGALPERAGIQQNRV